MSRVRTSIYLPLNLHKELKRLAIEASQPGDNVDMNDLLVIGAKMVVAYLKGGNIDEETKTRLEEFRKRIQGNGMR